MFKIFTQGIGEYGLKVIIKEKPSREDFDSIKGCIDNSFGKTLAPSYSSSDIANVLFFKGFMGVAIMKVINSVIYLDKLAILPEYRGKGLGRVLLNEIAQIYDSFVWRSGLDNPYNEFYIEFSSGYRQVGGWCIFWKNYTSEKRLARAIELLVAKPVDFCVKPF